MDKLIRFEKISDYNAFNNNETLHPLVSVVDFSKAHPRQHFRIYFGFYAVILKDVMCGDLRYGKNYYDYQEGTLLFHAPGQVISLENNGDCYQPKGYALVFHPDLIHGTPLGKHINDYSFFSYDVSEALHVSERERQLFWIVFPKFNLNWNVPLINTAKC